jgi:hypothetical protein
MRSWLQALTVFVQGARYANNFRHSGLKKLPKTGM